MFRGVLGCCAASALFAASAIAADLPVRAAPSAPIAAPPVFSWGGVYIGVNAGGLFGKAALTASPNPQPAFGALPFSQSLNPNGFAGGGQLGYSVQSGPLVYGAEADLQISSAKANGVRNGLPDGVGAIIPPWSNAASEKLDWFGTARGRLGYAFDRTLIYATGGLIFGDVRSSSLSSYTVSANPTHIYSGSASSVRVGFVVGGGVEYAFSANWSAKLEGLYFDLGKQSFTSAPLAANPPFSVANSARLTGEIVRLGLNYKFF